MRTSSSRPAATRWTSALVAPSCSRQTTTSSCTKARDLVRPPAYEIGDQLADLVGDRSAEAPGRTTVSGGRCGSHATSLRVSSLGRRPRHGAETGGPDAGESMLAPGWMRPISPAQGLRGCRPAISRRDRVRYDRRDCGPLGGYKPFCGVAPYRRNGRSVTRWPGDTVPGQVQPRIWSHADCGCAAHSWSPTRHRYGAAVGRRRHRERGAGGDQCPAPARVAMTEQLAAERFEARLSRGPDAPRIARTLLRTWAAGTLARDQLDTARLLVSELVTNAVLHGQGETTLRAWLRAAAAGRVLATRARDLLMTAGARRRPGRGLGS